LILSSSTLSVTRNVTVGADGGILNVLGNKVVLSGSLSGTGAIAIVGSSGGTLSLSGANTYSGGTEIDSTRLEVSSIGALGTGVVDVNGGGVLAITQSGSYANAIGFNVGGGTVEIGSGKSVVVTGSVSGNGNILKTGAGVISTYGSTSSFSGSLLISAGSVAINSSTPAWTATSGSPVNISSGASLVLNMGGTVNMSGKVTAESKTSSIYFNPADSSSVLKLSTTVPTVYTSGPIQSSVQLGISGKTIIYANGRYYQPYSATLPVGTPVWLDAEGSTLSATQRSLGYREVVYKGFFLSSIAATTSYLTSGTLDANGNTIYNYGTNLVASKKTTNLVGYWVYKDLPIMEGVDGKAYITDGHHTTAGYLEGVGGAILPGLNHVVLGTITPNPSSQTVANGTMWSDFSNANDAYLYGTSGNVLSVPGDAGYEGLQPILPSTTNPMPTTPSRSQSVATLAGGTVMSNDVYRSLTWGMVDGIVSTASTISNSKIKGYDKVNSLSTLSSQPDINFVEFYWADFLRNRVVWNDNAAIIAGNENLISAPLSFYLATANGIALAKSELYKDQFGRSLQDYKDTTRFTTNTTTWAGASVKNGLAVAGDTYNMYLTDDASITGDIIPSGLDGVTNKLTINTGTGMSISGALVNFASISINTGGSLKIDWNDNAVNTGTALAAIRDQNKTLTIPAGTANVQFSGDNDYSKLAFLTVGAGTLTINTANQTVDQTIWADISGSGSIRKTGAEQLSLTGANTFSGGLSLDEGKLVLGSPSVMVDGVLISSAAGKGPISVKAGATLAFDESVLLPNAIRFNAGSVSDALTTVDLGDNAVEFSGTVSAAVPLTVLGSTNSVLTLSGSGSLTGDLSVQSSLIRLNGGLSIGAGTINLRSGAGIQAGVNQVISSAIVVEDEARLDGGESVLTINGDISGYGSLRITGHPFGTVRLGGVNSYTGGTTVEGTRVDVAVNSADDNNDGVYGSGRVFGTGAVTFTNATLGFTTSAQIPNALLLDTELTVDVGSNTAELSGVVADSGAGTGGLYVKGNGDGALFLSGASNAYSGITLVDGTTLRLFHTADTSVLGVGTLASGSALAIELNNARLQIVPNLAVDGTLSTTPVTARNITIGALGATLDATDVSLNWSGVIAGGVGASAGKLTVTGNKGTQVELSGVNTYPGGTDVSGGVLLKVTSDSNLGASGTALALNGAGLYYAGSSALTLSRSLAVNGDSLIDMGASTLTLTGSLTGSGNLEVGRVGALSVWAPLSAPFDPVGITTTATSGTLVLNDSASGFKGRTIVIAGTLNVATSGALRNSTLEVNSGSAGSVKFATGDVFLGGLSGDGDLAFSNAGTLTVGTNGVGTRYTGIISGGSLALLKVGSGNLILGGANTYAGTTKVQEGSLTIDGGGALVNSKISLSSKVSLVISGVGRDLSSKFDSVASDALVVFNGTGANEVLQLPASFMGQTLNLGKGLIKIGTATASSGASVGAGVNIALTSIESTVTLSGGSVSLSSSGGAPLVLGGTASLVSKNASDVVQIKSGDSVTLTSGFPTTVGANGAKTKSFEGSFQAEGAITVTPENAAIRLEVPRLTGKGSVSLTSGSMKLNDSPGFEGTTSLGSGASAVLTGSLGAGAGGSVVLSSGASLSVVPENLTQAVSVPALSGGGDVSLGAGKIVLSGGNSLFTGSITVASGVDVTVKGDLPAGNVSVQDPKTPLKVDMSSGNISFPGSVTGAGALALTGSGTVTMTSSSSIGTTLLKVGTSSSDKAVLDVSSLSGGALVLSSSQTLSGGGKVVGSVVSNGVFSPGNSPGTFTVGKASNTGGDLTLNGAVLIEYGKNSGTGNIDTDVVVVGGTLTFGAGSSIVLSKYTDGSTYTDFATTTLDLGNIFQASTISPGSITASVSLASGGLLTKPTATIVGNSLQLSVVKLSYGALVSSPKNQAVGNYLSQVSGTTVGSGLGSLLSALDVSTSAAALEASLTSLNGQVYAEAQRLSLRRTAAISETLQGHLTAFPEGDHDGWTAWSESYAWGIHRDSTSAYGSWNGTNTGEVLGVQHTRKGLSLGVFGATGYSNASFSSSSVKGDSFHGGMYAHVEAGMPFFDVSWLAGSIDQTSARSISVGTYATSTSAKFQSSEYAVHLRGGLNIPKVAGSYLVTPSLALLCNGYSQNGVSESGADGAALTTDRVSKSAWQSRLGSEISRSFKAGTKPAALLASAYWIHDFDRAARSVNTRFSGASSAAGSYTTSGDAFGADGFEFGLGASVGLSPRTSARLSGSWQIRDGSNQPGVNLGLTVQF